jgi:hypothetical protein
VRRWIDRWNAYWFPETSTLSLAVMRIIAVGAQLFWFFPPLHNQLVLLEKNSHFIQPQMLIRIVAAVVPRELLFTPRAFTIFYWVVVAAGFAALIGLVTRLSLFVFALGVWIIIAHWYSYGDFHHESAVFCIFLLLLAFTPAGSRLSLDALIRRHRSGPAPDTADTAIWPLKVAHVLLALTYFTAGIAKVVVGGVDWVNGYTLQNYVFSDAIARGFPFGVWLAQQHTISIALSVFTLIFELCFFLSLVFPWTAPLFFLTGIGFHIGLYLAAGHDFFSHMVLLFLLLLFIQPEWLRAWLGSHVAVRRGLQSRPALT